MSEKDNSKVKSSNKPTCKKEEDKFEYNKDVAIFVCPARHMAIRRAKKRIKTEIVIQY